MPDTPRGTGPAVEEDDGPDEIASIESYETESGVVFYDADNPLAWMEANQPLSLDEFA